MEKLPIDNEVTPGNEIIPVEDARFTDTLDPYYEEIWNQLEDALVKSGLKTVEHYKSIWNNETLPQVFRDRAFTRIANRDARMKVHPDRYYSPIGHYVSNIKQNHLDGKKAGVDYAGWGLARIADWLRELIQYEQRTNTEVMEPSAKLVWAYVLYEKKFMEDAEFDQFIERLDPVAASPNFQDYNRDDYDDLGYNHPLKNRIDYLDHIFQEQTATKDMTRMKTWALDKLNLWLTNHDNKDALPHWLQSVDKKVALPLVRSVLKLRVTHRDFKENSLPFETLRNARLLYSWKDLLGKDDLYREDTEYFAYAPTVLERLKGESDLEHDLVSFIVQSSQPYHGNAQYLRSVAQRLGDEQLLTRVYAIDKKQRKETEQIKKERGDNYKYSNLGMSIAVDKERIARLQTDAKEVQTKLEQKEKYKGLLALLEQAGRYTHTEHHDE